ncbi:bifunctional diguanylate cyclase/phosphodiesterase [Cryobacterium sp. HLT2-28]|uniref:putative bifunctional diguanylate cyclase/phosphodiesterase n=1 Tax=Cryobacterium sp. HLT2-28 TaxID=1259146 RepID=UPI001069EE09|nr:EAL domain-containing protein [Cryobacterium sp. HLT2-28]TFB97126.1 EAL domain-containing protein [Cryobacterium sp. HLT2-28]
MGDEAMMRARVDAVLVWTMGLCAAAYLGGVVWQGGESHPAVDLWLSLSTSWSPAVVCWLAVARAVSRRREVLLAALAMTFLAVGDTYYVPLTSDWSPSFPNPGDLGYMLFYLLMLVMLVLLVRRDVRGQSRSVWLDCAVGSLGAAAVLAVVLNPVMASALAGSWSLATAVAVAYPLMDMFLMAAVTGIVVVRGFRGGDRLVVLVLGLMLYTLADIVYALQVTTDAYMLGTPLDALWAIGIALIALYVHGSEHRTVSKVSDLPAPTRAAALIMSGLATLAGLGVLVMGTRTYMSSLAVVLAGATVFAAAARTPVAFRQILRMADLRRQATSDHLTGLPNRRALYAQAGARMGDPVSERHALLLMDLDRFKEVNDSLGHQAGDRLLIQVGGRLSEQLRSGDLLVRLGGDEFALLLDGAGAEQATAVAAKLCAALAEPFALDDVAVHSAVSIGFALFPGDGHDLDTLLRKADVAMYKAKASGDGFHAYGGGDDTDFTTQLRTVDELRAALTTGQFVLHYQPKINLPAGDVHDVEALVRWNHPTRGLLYSDAFLTLVEEAGLMRALTRVVLHIALDQAAVWLAEGRNLTVAVNLSASSMIDTDLPDEVAAMLIARHLPPGVLKFEITEEFLMADRDRARDILTRLRLHGVQISIDDFGTGYSSLSYLRDLPIDELKLDRSFVTPMVDDARAAALVASTIGLAHSLGMRMVAEGVESAGAYDELVALGCDQAQGYHMSRPVPADELSVWLNARGAIGELTAPARF